MPTLFQFENVSRPWLWLILLAAGAWLLYATYRDIFDRSGRRLTWVLLALRAAGILALLLALAKPSLVHRDETTEPGRVALVVDNSLSMSLSEREGGSRYALAREIAARLRKTIESAPGPKVVVDLFDIRGSPLEKGLPDQPKIERTDLARALSQSAIRMRSKPLVAMILVSDGADNTGQPDLAAIRHCPVPVHTVGFHQDPDAGRVDLALRRVNAPPRVIVHNNAKAEVLVSKSDGPALDVTVTVKRGTETIAAQSVTLGAGRVEQMVPVTFAPTEAGRFVYTASVASEAGERLLANNAMHFPLQVESDPIRVFYIEGFLRHEYKFLKNRLEEDPDVSLVSIVRRARPGLVAAGPGTELLTPERLEKFDVVILGDMEGGYLAESEYQALTRWVDRGHSLLVLGGYRSFGSGGFRATPLADILPVVFADEEPYQTEDPFVLSVTPEGLRHPMFEISGDRVKDAALWNGAPPLLGASLVKQVKPAADILAVNPSVLLGGKPAPVAAVQRYGEGHTLVLAVDTTWRWSRLPRVMGQADTLFARFWSQTLRWLAGRSKTRERPPLTITTDRPDYETGQAVTIRAVRNPGQEGTIAGDVSVEVLGEDGRSLPVAMAAGSAEPDVFTGTFQPSTGGRYQVLAALTAAGAAVANQRTEFMVQGSGLEMADPRVNNEQLQTIAGATGGVFVPREQADTLADRIERRDRRTVTVRRDEYWNSPILFLFFIAAVTAEWILRRKNRLV